MPEERRRLLSRGDLWRIAWRSFALQASWSCRYRQNLGFAYALRPLLCRLRQRYPVWGEAAVQRALENFNTNPMLASYILGVVARLEEEGAACGRPSGEEISRLKAGLAGPLAALGDGFFWASWRPGCALLGMILAFRGSVWGALAFLLTYNLPHLFLRFWGVWQGYNRGVEVLKSIENYQIYDKIELVRWGFPWVLAGVVSSWSGRYVASGLETPVFWANAGLVLAGGWFLWRTKRPAAWLWLAVYAVGLGTAIIG